ncbi:unnamed protein product [Moneuplotes crassus]|uniref:Cyclin-like domain-containing protein n=1 Tax=Euplotes crassus TaxID=5936 RepID=A0AAD1XVD3_EUPCR|nr:unnamed protein product [Moneuplotes crassus]
MEINEALTLDKYLDHVATDLDNQYFPLSVVSPSELAGMSKEDERKCRLYGATLIQQLGILLRLPQDTISVGCSIFHRFYYKKTFMKCDCSIAACAALFIATKVEEQPRKLRDVVITFDYVKKILSGHERPIPVMLYGSSSFTSLNKDAVSAEKYMMKVLGFSLKIDTAYKYLCEYIRILQGTGRLRQKAWNYINDAYKTVAVVCFPPNAVAVTAIYIAASNLNYGLPDCEWYKVFGVHDIRIIKVIGSEILQLYEADIPDHIFAKRVASQ